MSWGTNRPLGGGFTGTAQHRIPFVNAALALTDSANYTWNDTTNKLTLLGTDTTVVVDASVSGNPVLDMKKGGTSRVKLRTGTVGETLEFLLSNGLNYITATGASSYIGIAVNGKETLFKATKIELPDAYDIDFGTTTGTKIGQAAAKIGLYGVTPVARQVLATGAGATVDNVITALQNLGAVKQS